MTPLSAKAAPWEALKQDAQVMEAGELKIPEVMSTSSKRALEIGKVLADRKAIMFGAYWCPYCDQERQELGRDVFSKASNGGRPMVRYVECDPRGANAETNLCRQAGVQSYPTWALAASSPDAGASFQLYRGKKGLFGLEQMVGLPSPPDPSAVAPPIERRSGVQELAVAGQLAERGITMYGTWWCGFCDAQRQLFGQQAWAKVPYVECDPRAAGAELKKCQAAGIQAFPEWVLPDGRHFSGLLQLDKLEALSIEVSRGSGSRDDSSTRTTVLPMPGAAGAACEDCKVGVNSAGLTK